MGSSRWFSSRDSNPSRTACCRLKITFTYFCLQHSYSWDQQRSCSELFQEYPAPSHHFQLRHVPRCNRVKRNRGAVARNLLCGVIDLRRLWRVEESRSSIGYAPCRIQAFQRGRPNFHTHRHLHFPRIGGCPGNQVLPGMRRSWGTWLHRCNKAHTPDHSTASAAALEIKMDDCVSIPWEVHMALIWAIAMD